MSDIENTTNQRATTYGDFTPESRMADALLGVLERQPGWMQQLNPTHRQGLRMILAKIARIVNGDPNYADNWHDIQGYAKIVEDRLVR
jgi:hypothetical protein